MKWNFSDLLVFGALILTMGCKDEGMSTIERLKAELRTIDNYLEEYNIEAVKQPDGIRMHVTTLGTGLPAKVNSTVDVDYSGRLFPDGPVFDDGPNIKISLNDVILGWQNALVALPAGSTATVYIPSVYGYGGNGQHGIPANSILQFEMKFKGVQLTSTEISRFTTDTTSIDDYLLQNNIEAITDATGIRYVVHSSGATSPPGYYDVVKVKYEIRLMSDGKLIATMTGEPSTSFLSRVIDYNNYGLTALGLQGVMAGMMKLGEGGKATLYIPSYLAFATSAATDNGVEVIPPNSNLVVELELLDIIR